MEYALIFDTSRSWTTFLLELFWRTRRIHSWSAQTAKLTGLDFLHPGLVLHCQVLALLGHPGSILTGLRDLRFETRETFGEGKGASGGESSRPPLEGPKA